MIPAGDLVLLDTSVLIHLLRDTSLGKRILKEQALETRAEKPVISVVTVGELLAFAKKRGWGTRKIERLEELVSSIVVADIRPRPILDKYAEIDAFCEANGRALGKNDLWIAATAAATNATLVTADKDFDPLAGEHIKRVYYDPRGTY